MAWVCLTLGIASEMIATVSLRGLGRCVPTCWPWIVLGVVLVTASG